MSVRPALRRAGSAAVVTTIAGALTVPLSAPSATATPVAARLVTARPVAAHPLPRTSFLATRPMLAPGNRNAAVRWVQTVLKVRPRSGYYGPITRGKVVGFQRRYDLRADGRISRDDWNVLRRVERHQRARAAAVERARSRAYRSTARVRGVHRRNAHVLSEAARLRGRPYAYGGTTPRGFDCSGYVRYVYRRAGVTLPRASYQIASRVRRISRGAAVPGDLVFFYSTSGRVYHVGIYAGGAQIWHSPRPGTTVRRATIWSSRVFFGRA
jgi:cell wall-associated NlpC family hydrolase